MIHNHDWPFEPFTFYITKLIFVM